MEWLWQEIRFLMPICTSIWLWAVITFFISPVFYASCALKVPQYVTR